MSHIDPAVFFDLIRVQADYARCIDDDRLEEWPAFFEEQCLYRITSASSYREGYEASVVFANSRGMLTDRVTALREANIYERQAYRHILGMPSVIGNADGDNKYLRTETSFLVARVMQDGTTDLYATGRYLDVWTREMKLRERIVVCDSARFDTLLAIPL